MKLSVCFDRLPLATVWTTITERQQRKQGQLGGFQSNPGTGEGSVDKGRGSRSEEILDVF